MIKDSLKDKNDEEKLKNLIRTYSSKNLLIKEIIRLIKNRKNIFILSDKIYSKPESEISEFFHRSFLEYFKKIFYPQIDEVIISLNKINNAVQEGNGKNQIVVEIENSLRKLKSAAEEKEIIKILMDIKAQAFTKKIEIKAQGYLKKDLRIDLLKEINNAEHFFKEFSELEYPENYSEIEDQLAMFGRDIINFFKKANSIYEKKKKENGYLDYEDILLHTKNILEIENVRKDLSGKYKYIMIDEYQDTNEIQYNIFLPILEKLKTGNLFIVGDEKQSIYMFRDAELEVFNVTKNDIKSVSGSEFLLTLPDSFRMAPAICLFTNVLFNRLFSEPNLLFNEVKHSDLVCARADEIQGQIEILLAENESKTQSVNNYNLITNTEAEIAAKRILKLIYEEGNSEKPNWNDIAVLCRKRKYFHELEKVFVKYNIPFVILGGKGFYQRQSVYDIYNYFSFLSDEQNDTALIGILRSPFFSLSDSIIFEISLQEGKTFWKKLNQFVSENNKLNEIIQTLKENLSLAKNYNITALLRKILNESDLLAVLSSKQNGNQEIANIEKLIKLTINFFSQGFKTLYDYVIYLKDSIEEFEDEAQAAVTDDSNSVKIMTFHQSKGLEFDTIILYGCNEPIKRESIKSKSITIDKNFGFLTKVPIKSNYLSEYNSAPIIGISNLISERKNLAEFKRLLYVGITRAKNNLFISGSLKKDDNTSPNSFLALLQKGLGMDFNSQSFEIKSKLNFLQFENNKYLTSEKEFSTNVKIVKDVEYVPPILNNDQNENDKKELKIYSIDDNPKGEIISATKISVYKQCPLKYHLTYDLGFSSLYQNYKKWLLQTNVKKRYEFNAREDESLFNLNEIAEYKNILEFSDVKGRIIHSILQKEIGMNQFDNFIEDAIINEISGSSIDEKRKEIFKKDISTDLINFYKSNVYSELKNFQNYFNEYEIYTKENDYFLYGIIDKLIIDEDNAIIVDYKTDSISEEDLKEKSHNYFNQLRFYSYLVNRLFNKIKSFELRLIFIKLPEQPQILRQSNKDFEAIKKEIQLMVTDIRNQNYVKNLDHCASCGYSLKNKKCVKN